MNVSQTIECEWNNRLFLVLWVHRILGIAPLSFTPTQRGYRVAVSRPWTIYGYALLIVCGLINTYLLIYGIVSYHEGALRYMAKLSSMLKLFNFVVTSYIFWEATLTAPRRMSHFIMYMKRVQEIHLRLRYSPDLKLWITWVFILYSFFGIALLQSADSIMNEGPQFFKDSYSVSIFCLKLVMFSEMSFLKCQLAIVMHTIWTALPPINKDLSQILSNLKVSTRPLHKVIRQYSSMSSCICVVIFNINDEEGSLYFAVFTHLIIVIFVTVYNNWSAFREGSTNTVILGCSWLMFHLSHILMNTETCHRLKMEMNKTNDILCKIVTEAPASKELLTEITNYLKQLTLIKGISSPLGVFSLTRSFIFTTFSVIATFVAIIFQFQLFQD